MWLSGLCHQISLTALSLMQIPLKCFQPMGGLSTYLWSQVFHKILFSSLYRFERARICILLPGFNIIRDVFKNYIFPHPTTKEEKSNSIITMASLQVVLWEPLQKQTNESNIKLLKFQQLSECSWIVNSFQTVSVTEGCRIESYGRKNWLQNVQQTTQREMALLFVRTVQSANYPERKCKNITTINILLTSSNGHSRFFGVQ